MSMKQIFKNGNVVTMDPDAPETTAFGIIGDRFHVIGSDEEIRKWTDEGTELVDLKGKTVIPGFIETHNHMSHFSLSLSYEDCGSPPNQSIEDVMACIKQAAASREPGQWIRGRGYDDTLIAEKRHLTRTDLDEVSPKNPVFISHISGHLAYTNSIALDMANIGPGTPQPQGGEIRKDENGVPTGLLLEPSALMQVALLIPRPNISMYKEYLVQGINHFHQEGITSIHDGAVGFQGAMDLTAFRDLEAEGKLSLRVYMTIIEILYQKIFEAGLGKGFGSDYLKLGAVKMFQDGSIQGLTGALEEPYYNKPDFRGELINSQENLDSMVEKYHQAGLQIAIHANGDRAIESTLMAFEKADCQFPGKDLRHMIIHCQTASMDHIARMKQLGVVPSYFVNHVYYWGDRHVSIFLGPERAARISPLASSLKQGLTFTLHSDLPVTPVDPLFSIHCAVNRITREGKVLGAEERISPLEALKAYTTHAAYCSFEEDLKGSIKAGKLADFTVLSDNPLTVAPDKIKDIKVEQTHVGGRRVYERDK